jgi:hypothetical protein
MMLTIPNPRLRKRLLQELMTEEGGIDWNRLRDLAALAGHDTVFHFETEGLAEPALNMLLSPEGAGLRRALISDLVHDPDRASQHIEQLAPILVSDQSLSGRAILDKLVAFLLSPEGEETRAQIAEGLRAGDNGHGRFELTRLLDLASMASRLHPGFSASTLLGSVGGYLLSEDGRPARNQFLAAGTQWAVGAIVGTLGRLGRSPEPPSEIPAAGAGKQQIEPQPTLMAELVQ